ncbi:hypothetical protein E4U09_008260, partial [Claviceps aff. purpurea]
MVISLQLRQRFDKVAAQRLTTSNQPLPRHVTLTTSSNQPLPSHVNPLRPLPGPTNIARHQPPPSHVNPFRPLPRLANIPHQQCATSPKTTDSLTTSARESIAPSAPSAHYRSPTVSDGSEDETDIPTASARSSQSRAQIASDESVASSNVSSNVSDTPRASENYPMLPLDPVQVVGDLDVPCLTVADQKLLKNFE